MTACWGAGFTIKKNHSNTYKYFLKLFHQAYSENQQFLVPFPAPFLLVFASTLLSDVPVISLLEFSLLVITCGSLSPNSPQ